MTEPAQPRVALAYSVDAVACPDPAGRPGWVQIITGEGVGSGAVLKMPWSNVEGWLEVYCRSVRDAAETSRRQASGLTLPGAPGFGINGGPLPLQGPPPGHPG